jgi:hypothetical protein
MVWWLQMLFDVLHCVLEAFEVQTRWLFRRGASELKSPGNAVVDGCSGSCRIGKVDGLGKLMGRRVVTASSFDWDDTIPTFSAFLRQVNYIHPQQIGCMS